MTKPKPNISKMLVGLGSAIRERRIGLGMSQEDLADQSGLHRTYLSDIEHGKRNITLGSLVQIAGALNESPEKLFKILIESGK